MKTENFKFKLLDRVSTAKGNGIILDIPTSPSFTMYLVGLETPCLGVKNWHYLEDEITLIAEEVEVKSYYITRDTMKQLYDVAGLESQFKIRSITEQCIPTFSNQGNLPASELDELRVGAYVTLLSHIDKLFPKPKKKVTKEISRWVNVYPSGGLDTFINKDWADENSGKSRIACVELKGTYEIEVD